MLKRAVHALAAAVGAATPAVADANPAASATAAVALPHRRQYWTKVAKETYNNTWPMTMVMKMPGKRGG